MPRPRKNSADYFSHDNGMRNDVKIKAIRSRHGIAGYAVWCMLLETLTDSDNFRIEVDEISLELMAGDFGIDTDEFLRVMDSFRRLKLIQWENNTITCAKLIERMSPLLADRERKRAWNEAKKGVSDVHNRVSDGNKTGETLQSKVKESKVKNKKEKERAREGAGSFEEEIQNPHLPPSEEKEEEAPQVPPPPQEDPDPLHVVRVWCAQHLDDLRKMAGRAGYNEQHGKVSDQVTLFCSHYALDSDYQNAPLKFFRAKFPGWLTKAKQIAEEKPKRADRQPRQSRKADAAPKETPPPPGGYTPEFVTAAFRSRYGSELCERLTNSQINRLTQATGTECLSEWMEGFYTAMKNGKQQGRTGLVSIGSAMPAK